MHQKAKEKEAEDAKKAGENGEVCFVYMQNSQPKSCCRVEKIITLLDGSHGWWPLC